MWIKGIFYALLAFSFIFIGMMLVETDIAEKYNVTLTDSDSTSFNKVDESLSIIKNMSNTMYNAENTDTSAFYLMTRQVVQSVRLFFKLPEIIINLLSYMGEKIGIPGWIIGILIVVIIITITLYVIGIFAKVPWGG